MTTYSSYTALVHATTASLAPTHPPKLHLYFHTPQPIFQARVNMPGTISYPLQSLTFDTVTLGAYTDIFTDLTLLLGTTEGGDELGRTRVKNIASSTEIPLPRTSLGVEDGTLYIQDNAYITVLRDVRPWAKLPYFDIDGGVDYKDGDIEIGTYNEDIPPVANTGPAMAGTVNPESGTLLVQFPPGGMDISFAMADGATIVSYAWDLNGGTFIDGTAIDADIVGEFEPGYYLISLTVVDSNGRPHTAFCSVLAIDPANDPCYQKYNLSQRMTQEGQTLDIELFDFASRADYPDGTLVLFWWDEPVDASDRSHMKFVGWLDTETGGNTRVKTGTTPSLSLHAVDIAGRLNQLPGFPQALTRDLEPDDELEEDVPLSPWSFMPTLDINKALYYIIFWHSTALSIADFFLPVNGVDYDAMRLDSGASTLFDQMNSLAKKIVPDHYFVCNSQGQLSVIRDWMLDDLADRPTVYPIITEDSWNELRYEYNRHPKVHVLRSGAILCSTDWIMVDGEETLPLVFSLAPGASQAFGQGAQEATESEGLALSQDDLNKSEGHRYAMFNSRYGSFSFSDPTISEFWNYEPALFNRVQVQIDEVYAGLRGFPFTQITGQMKTVDVRYTASKQGVQIAATAAMTREEVGFPAYTYNPEDDSTTPPDTTPYVPDYGLTSSAEEVVLIGPDGYVYRTSNFQTTPPTWDEQLVSGTPWIAGYSWVVDPFSPGYRDVPGGDINGWVIDRDAVYRVEDLFGSPSSAAVYTFAVGGTGHSFRRTIAASFGRYEDVEADNPWLMALTYYASSPADGFKIVYSRDAGATWSSEITVSANVATGGTAGLSFQAPAIWMSPRTPGKAIIIAATSTGATPTMAAYVTTDWGATWSVLTDPLIQSNKGLGSSIHIPWDDNLDESLVYHGHVTVASTMEYRLKRVDGTSITDISPTFTGKVYGTGLANGLFGVRAYDSDRQFMVMCGVSDNGTGTTNFQMNVSVSSNAGETWTEIVAPYGDGNWYNWQGYQAAFAGDDPDAIYIVGSFSLEETTSPISFTPDFGATVLDKSGNLKVDFWDTNERPNIIMGIAGGPTA